MNGDWTLVFTCFINCTNQKTTYIPVFRVSKYQIIEEKERTHDDSGMDVPYSRVSINLLGDPDIQNALNKSASAEDLISPRGFSLVCLVIVATHGILCTCYHRSQSVSNLIISYLHTCWSCMLFIHSLLLLVFVNYIGFRF